MTVETYVRTGKRPEHLSEGLPDIMTGQAAGTAAALALEQGVSLQNVDMAVLQERLAGTGVLIHIPDYLKGNQNRNVTENPKYMADPLIKADALSYH